MTILCFALILIGPYKAERFDYEAERAEGIQFIQDNMPLIRQVVKGYEMKMEDVISVTFPELIRYSLVRDFIETSALEAIYVEHGTEGADFSIGRFQMKPSFAEKVEEGIRGNPRLWGLFKGQLGYKYDTETTIRSERLRRLASLEGQLRYTCAFVALMNERFRTEQFDRQVDRIRLYAATYNYGLDEPTEDINNWMSVKAFPFGLKFETKQYAYADLAADFYERIKQ